MAEVIRAYRNRYNSGPQGVAFENLVFKDTLGSPAVNATLWDNCPLICEQCDPGYGRLLDTRWFGSTAATNAIGGWTTTVATSGTVTIDATKGLKLSAGAATANQGVNFQLQRTAFTPTANKPIWMEASLNFTGLTSLNIQFLFGL